MPDGLAGELGGDVAVGVHHQHRSTTITTNKSVKVCPGILATDEAMTAAVLDRLQGLEKVLK